MPSDNIVPITEGICMDAQKQVFLDLVAQSFDLYVQDNGYVPEGLVYVLGGSRQGVRSGWLATGDSAKYMGQVLASAQAVLMRDLMGFN